MSRFVLRRLISRFARAREGTTAIEFAIIATPFLMLMFGIIELGMVFMVSTTLQNATDNASRKIRTGEFQTSGASAKTDFQALVCANMNWLQSDCPTKLSIDVQVFPTFAALSGSGPADPTKFDPTKTSYTVPAASQIVLVRAYYDWSIFTPLLNAALVNEGAGSGRRLIGAAAAFQTEPFPPP
jgi:Flp pilus assembly protein TadG